jgi:hypothetical protein
MKRTLYYALVESLNYVAVATCPDITFTIGRLAFFLECYHPEHWSVAVQVLQYLKGTCSLCPTLGSINSLHLLGYSNSDYTNYIDTSHSIGGYCFSLGYGAIF